MLAIDVVVDVVERHHPQDDHFSAHYVIGKPISFCFAQRAAGSLCGARSVREEGRKTASDERRRRGGSDFDDDDDDDDGCAKHQHQQHLRPRLEQIREENRDDVCTVELWRGEKEEKSSDERHGVVRGVRSASVLGDRRRRVTRIQRDLPVGGTYDRAADGHVVGVDVHGAVAARERLRREGKRRVELTLHRNSAG